MKVIKYFKSYCSSVEAIMISVAVILVPETL